MIRNCYDIRIFYSHVKRFGNHGSVCIVDINFFVQWKKLERILTKLINDSRVLITADLNIDLIKFADDESTLSYLPTSFSWQYWPYITLPTRITSHLATYIDHVFVKMMTIPNIVNGIFYFGISDHLPCFISIHHVSIYPIGEYCVKRIVQILKLKWNIKTGNKFTKTGMVISIPIL